jgi:hypothetical protein
MIMVIHFTWKSDQFGWLWTTVNVVILHGNTGNSESYADCAGIKAEARSQQPTQECSVPAGFNLSQKRLHFTEQ